MKGRERVRDRVSERQTERERYCKTKREREETKLIYLQVDEDEYLELLPERTPLMLLARDQLWSPTLTNQG